MKMFRYHRYHQHRKADEGSHQHQSLLEYESFYKRLKPTLFRIFFAFSIVLCYLVFAPWFLGNSTLFFFYMEGGNPSLGRGTDTPSCSSIINGTICCDRSRARSDICFLKGDIRTSSSAIFLYSGSNTTQEEQHKIRPYTRKWETSVMNTIRELTLIKTKSLKDGDHHSCEVHHSVPAIFFSTGGYTGNAYHEFNDGILPLYITSQHLRGEVIFMILEYHAWWITKYGEILSLLSNYPPVDFTRDNRTHCFSEATVGLNIHDELTINSSLMQDKRGTGDFRNMLENAYRPRIRALEIEDPHEVSRPKLVIVSRNGSRSLVNEMSVVRLAEEIGFKVEVISPVPSMELAKIYRVLSSSDAMVGIHGAAMSHFLFMRPGSVVVQVIPLGTEWAAQTYYGEPVSKFGLKYLGYRILPRESSLSMEYDEDDPVLRDPDTVNAKGWEATKRIYLGGQNVTVDLKRFRKILVRAYNYTVAMAARKEKLQNGGNDNKGGVVLSLLVLFSIFMYLIIF